ncbi:MAG: hypothetical protein ACLR6B_03100 [Blautia sp.]
MHEVLKAVDKIVGKGDPIVMTGMTCSGKSTVLGTLAKNDIVKALLWFREGLVQGRTHECRVQLLQITLRSQKTN